jgi:small-conductance mechanosensitive channel
MTFLESLRYPLFGNTLIAYGYTFLIFGIGVALILTGKKVLSLRLGALAKKTATDIDDRIVEAVMSRLPPLLFIGAAYLSLQHLVLRGATAKTLTIGGTALATFFSVRLVVSLLRIAYDGWLRKRNETERQGAALNGVFTGLQAVIWGIALMLLLDNVGVKISALVAGLGIGGIAVALASQAILGDLFAYVTIFFDRPFSVGDFIIVDGLMGTVEHVGIKTTRMQSLDGEQLVFCNSDLTKARIRNYRHMRRRRVVFGFGVTYSTPAEKIGAIPAIVKAIIERIQGAAIDRAHFKSFGDFSLNFEIVYYVNIGDYTAYMDIQQAINLGIVEAFTKEKIEFAFPTQQVILTSIAGDLPSTDYNRSSTSHTLP